jgi:hypothetical protein
MRKNGDFVERARDFVPFALCFFCKNLKVDLSVLQWCVRFVRVKYISETHRVLTWYVNVDCLLGRAPNGVFSNAEGAALWALCVFFIFRRFWKFCWFAFWRK